MLIDSHCHLTDELLRDKAEDIINGLASVGIDKVVTIGIDLASSKECVALAQKHPSVYATVGIFPSDACLLTTDPCEELLTISKDDNVVAIGEIGLDYHYDDDKDKQKYWFDRQLSLVGKADLPVVFHIRDAYEDVWDIVRAHKTDLKRGGVLHCYSGSYEYARQFLDLGFYVSFSGTVTFKNAAKAPECAAKLPLERILVETDSPYLAPVPLRGTLNEPKNVAYTARKIAEIRNITFEQVARATSQNAYDLFFKMKK
jgi:TatD DNase family protein